MKLCILPALALSWGILAAPVTRDALSTAQSSIDQLISHLKSDRDAADLAIRDFQKKVLNYRQSVEGYETWRGYIMEHDKALAKAEEMRRFLMKVDGIHELRREDAFGFQGLV